MQGVEPDVLPQAVRAAWALEGPADRLDGGQGTSVRVGDIVLKPHSTDVLVEWHAQLRDRVSAQGFRLPQPVPARDGRLVVDGWSATAFLAGCPVPDEDRSADAWFAVLAASRAFHTAVSAERRPAFLDARTDRWALADRAAWHEDAPRGIGPRSSRLLPRIRELVIDEQLPAQVVHGDLSGNVLLAEGMVPAIIDISPYWRPAAYADAIVVVDALLWWRADPSLLRDGRPEVVTAAQWRSLLARALVFRLLAFDELQRSIDEVRDQLPRYDEVLHVLADHAT